MEQVVINLLVNACHAVAGRSKGISIVTGVDEVTGRVFLEVADEGLGMTLDVIQRIKDPFFTTKRETGGTGLGLSISDRIVQDHGGVCALQGWWAVTRQARTVTMCFPCSVLVCQHHGRTGNSMRRQSG